MRRRRKVVCVWARSSFVVFFLTVSLAAAQPAVSAAALPELLSQFKAEPDRAQKELILLKITMHYPNAGPDLLALANPPSPGDTNWLAIRGIGELKYAPAVPFLEQSLSSPAEYIRSNAARALGEIGDPTAIGPLIAVLANECKSGVIEQTALALQMLRATQAVPALEAKISNPSAQTRSWILGAVEALGGRAQLPFIAALLQDPSPEVRFFAAASFERLSGEDFGIPKCSNGPCSFDEQAVKKAQLWWSAHQQEWNR
jgi:HEAT repeat protein